MDDLLGDFIAETREMLEALGGEIVAWEAEPGDRARLDEIFRFVHTVKGNSGFFDLTRLGALSHAAEDALADVRSGKREANHAMVSAVLAIIDRIAELVDALERGEELTAIDDSDLIDALAGAADAPAVDAADAAAGGEAHATVGLDARKSLRSVRLSLDLVDRMMSGVSDLVLARNELSRRMRENDRDIALEAAFERVSACIADMRETITRTRMQRIDTLFVSLPRMVRDLAAELDKQVALEVEGADVELDREMIEMIRDPLTHIVRNAIDHGMEGQAERAEAGKLALGTLTIRASQSGNQILIDIADDGRGIDPDRLVRKAIENGAITADQADRLRPSQRIALIFEPGLSSKDQVTEISGRGVGMDVVRANVERIGGVVDVDSKLGEGTRITLRLPLTLTIIPALTVEADGRRYAIPRAAIDEIVRCDNANVRMENLGGAHIVTIREKRLPLLDLNALFGKPGEGARRDQSMIVLRPAGTDAYALAVDAVFDHEELVVKPAAPLVMASGLYAGTTLADDGSPILLLDPSGLAEAGNVELGADKIERADLDDVTDQGAPALLLVVGEGRKRLVRMGPVDRIEDVAVSAIQQSAGRLRIAIGDKIVPLAGSYDAKAEKVRVLRLNDGINEIAYAFTSVADMLTFSGEVTPASVPGEVEGVALVNGEQVELVDCHWLFATHGDGAPMADASERPLCALPAGDPWVETILRPLIESAGYRTVLGGDEAEAADLVIATDGAGDAAPAKGRVLRLRAHPEPAHAKDESIYRYDRLALMNALGQRAGGAK